MKTVTLLVACIMLFAGGMANAFSTCPMKIAETSAEMQMGGDMDMPCHETKDSEDQSSDQCNGCDCQHCVQTNALPVKQSKNHYERAAVGIPADQLSPSRQIETPFQPPKHLS